MSKTSAKPAATAARMDARKDGVPLPPAVQTILRAMKTYGMFVADNGSNWYVSGAPDSRWNNTRLVTEQRTIDPNFAGRAVPRTPGHQLHSRADYARSIAGHLASIYVDAAAQSSSFLDRANFARIPGRLLLGAGTRVELVKNFGVSLSVDNLANERVVEIPPERAIDVPLPTPLSDVAGFPLPGRSFYVSLDYRH